MRIIMLSRDPLAFDPASSVSKRIQEYRNLVEDIILLVFNPQRNKLWGLWQFYRLAKKRVQEKLQKGDKDMLITSQDPFELGLVAYLLKRKHKLPLQLQVHTDLLSPFFTKESRLNRIRLRIARFVLPKADGIRVVSERIRTSLVNELNIKDDRITVLPIFVDLEMYRGVHKIEQENSFTFLTVARLSREKNIGLAIQALAEVIKKHPEARMTIVGEGPEKLRLQSMARELGVSEYISFPGAVWKSGLVPYFSAADCFFLVSNYEGYAMAVVEAMSAGLPIIMTDVGLAGWLIRDKQEGVVVSVSDKDALISAMLHMMDDADARARYGRAVHDTVSKLAAKEEHLAMIKKAWQNCINP